MFLLSLVGPDPRVIADDIWAKLLWAGLNLTADDLPIRGGVVHPDRRRCFFYPLEMVHAMALVWLLQGCALMIGAGSVLAASDGNAARTNWEIAWPVPNAPSMSRRDRAWSRLSRGKRICSA